MDPETIVMNGSFDKWMICKGVEVAITFLGEYYVGRGVVVRVTSTDPLLVFVFVQEVSDAIEIPMPFPDDNIKRRISQCNRAGYYLEGLVCHPICYG
jgi:hypothetical protein